MKKHLLQKELQRRNIDYLLLTNSDPSFTYFTQLKNLSFSLLAFPQTGKPLLFLTPLDKEKKPKLVKKILIKNSLSKTLEKNLSLHSLAYNSDNLTLSFYRKLKKIFPHASFRNFSSFLQKLREEKTSLEITYLKKAAELTQQAFQEIIKRLRKKNFKREKDIKIFLEYFASKKNTELSFPPIIASGSHTKNPHHQPSNSPLTKGFLLLDFGLSYKNYCCDLTRTLYLGEPSEKEKRIYLFLLTLQKEIIQTLKPSLKISFLEKETRKKLKKFSHSFIHSLGHGVGLEVHEPPYLKPTSSSLIKKNHVFTIEPGLYFRNFGLRIEDLILMKDKPFVLTKVKKELIVIP